MLRPSYAVGQCMRGYNILPGDALTFDDAAALHSGDIARVWALGIGICKQLLVDKRGRWFLQCSDGLVPISRWSFTFDGEPERLIEHKPGTLPAGAALDPALIANRKDVALYVALTGLPARPEFVPGVPWPGQAAALDAFPYPPEFDANYPRVLAAVEAAPSGASLFQLYGIAVESMRATA